jgi:6-phosphogluconolactonase (cycloisomerase 2 family)
MNATSGALTELAGSPFSTSGATAPALLSPHGRFLLQYNGTTSSFQRYLLDPTTGIPTLQPNVTTPTAAGPHTVFFDPSGKNVYVANLGESSVSSYSIDTATGAMTLINTLPAGTSIFGVAPYGFQ